MNSNELYIGWGSRVRSRDVGKIVEPRTGLYLRNVKCRSLPVYPKRTLRTWYTTCLARGKENPNVCRAMLNDAECRLCNWRSYLWRIPWSVRDSSPVTGSTVSRHWNLTAWIKYRVNWCLPLVIASQKSHSLPAITRNLNPCQLAWSLVAVGSTFQVCKAFGFGRSIHW